ncbi:MAG: hypothetical protein ACR2PK_01100 [Acidimicrobiales bacterium]
MSIHDRIRRELHRTAEELDVSGAGPDQIASNADSRVRRARIVGGVAAFLLVVGVAGFALAVRSEPNTDQETLSTAPQPATQSSESQTTQITQEPEPPGTGDVQSDTTEEDGSRTDGTEPLADSPTATPNPSDDTTEDDTASTDPETESPGVGGLNPSATIEMLAHRGGFVALREGGALEFSENGSSWIAIADPRPAGAGQIRDVDSHAGILYATGTSGESGRSSWLSASEDLASWSPISVPETAEGRSELSSLANIIYSIDASAAGLIATGETLAFVDVSQLVSAEVFANDAWTLGNSTGDTSKLVVYDLDDGNPTDEIDLAAAGVPVEVLDVLSSPDPVPFVVTGTLDSVDSIETNLDPGSVLGDLSWGNGRYLGAAFNNQFRARTAWESTDARAWSGIPISVVRVPRAETIGMASGNDLILSGEGPLLTAQVREGSNWTEIRLDRVVGSQNANYQIVDASFGGAGVAVAVAVSDATSTATFYLIQSPDAVNWTATELASVLPGKPQLAGVESIAVGRARVAVSYLHIDGTHRTATVGITTG